MHRPQTLAAAIVAVQTSIDNCRAHGNTEWLARWQTRMARLKDLLPSGGGIDSGTTIESIDRDAIVLSCSFHHMNENGYYDGWTEHKIRILPCFDGGVDVRVSGRNRNEIRDYLGETYEYTMTRHVTWNESTQRWHVESDDERYAAMRRAYPEQTEQTEGK